MHIRRTQRILHIQMRVHISALVCTLIYEVCMKSLSYAHVLHDTVGCGCVVLDSVCCVVLLSVLGVRCVRMVCVCVCVCVWCVCVRVIPVQRVIFFS